MASVIINDKAFEKVREALQRCGRYMTKYTRTIIEAIIWRIRTSYLVSIQRNFQM